MREGKEGSAEELETHGAPKYDRENDVEKRVIEQRQERRVNLYSLFLGVINKG